MLDLQNTTQQPVLASLMNGRSAGAFSRDSEHRCDDGGPNDAGDGCAPPAQLRELRGRLLGFATHADYVLDDQMAKTPNHARKLLTGLVPAATAKARREAARLQKMPISAGKGG